MIITTTESLHAFIALRRFIAFFGAGAAAAAFMAFFMAFTIVSGPAAGTN